MLNLLPALDTSWIRRDLTTAEPLGSIGQGVEGRSLPDSPWKGRFKAADGTGVGMRLGFLAGPEHYSWAVAACALRSGWPRRGRRTVLALLRFRGLLTR